MFTPSRFTRIFLLAIILVTIPAVFLFYSPSSAENLGGDAYAVDQGGIDSPHWRDPVKPNAEGGFGHHVVEGEVEGEKDNGEPKDEEDWIPDQSEPGGSGGEPPAEGVVENIGSGGERPNAEEQKAVSSGGENWLDVVPDVDGAIIMPEMGNATAKAELGRGTWRLLHLITMRFPDHPTDDDRAALKTFFYMFARLYPCGDCAKHFQKVLKEYPPQTASRQNAALWLCSVHNIVNKRLHKPEFDCTKLDETWDCGCGNSTTVTVMPQTAVA